MSSSTAEDPHRTKCQLGWYRLPVKGLAFEEDLPNQIVAYRHATWFQLLDWAVYHGPKWRSWQLFRKSLVGTRLDTRHDAIRRYWIDRSGDDAEQKLLNAVRVVNLLRSLRGQHSKHPELKELLEKMNRELSFRWHGEGDPA